MCCFLFRSWFVSEFVGWFAPRLRASFEASWNMLFLRDHP
eukprot:COSAG06_NODE_24559_length_659_cov_0.876786_1_plen_39_part_10